MEQPLRRNFTKRWIDDLTPVAKRVTWHDITTRGLCLRVEPSGTKSFCWRRKLAGRTTFKLIGKFPDLSVENARHKADEFNSDSGAWKANDYVGPSPFERRHGLTLGAVLDDYVERRLRGHAKNPERAASAVRWAFEKYLSAWRDRKLDSLRPQDVADLHLRLGQAGKKVTANRVVQFLRTLCNWARDEMHWSGENLVKRKFKFFAERSSERFLQADEAARLFAALREEPQRDLQHFVVLALFTGARRGDVLSMRWEDINFETNVWRIPDPKSKKPYLVPLVAEAVEILQQRKNDQPWVFPGTGKTGHVTGFKHSWPALLKRAGITRFRIHDLRHTLASWQVAAGSSLPIISRSLGHQTTAMTERYAKLNVDPVRQSLETATRALLAAKPKK